MTHDSVRRSRMAILMAVERAALGAPTKLRQSVLRRARAVLHDSAARESGVRIALRRPPRHRYRTGAILLAVAIGALGNEVFRESASVCGREKAAAPPAPMLDRSPFPASNERRTSPTPADGPRADSSPSSASDPELPPRPAPDRGTPPVAPDELALLDRARRSFAREDFGSALTALTAHYRRFPTGRLAEERDALSIVALARLTRLEAAERRFDAFRRTFPRSVLIPQLAELLRASEG